MSNSTEKKRRKQEREDAFWAEHSREQARLATLQMWERIDEIKTIEDVKEYLKLLTDKLGMFY